jgi:hypothetical protein
LLPTAAGEWKEFGGAPDRWNQSAASASPLAALWVSTLEGKIMAVRKRESVVDAQDEMFRRLNVKVSLDAYERLLLHAIKANRAPGELVTELINGHLRQWKVSANNPQAIVNRNRLEVDGQVRNSDAA